MNNITLSAEQIYSRLVKARGDGKYYYYLIPFTEKISFFATHDFEFAHTTGELKEITLTKMTNTLYKLKDFECYVNIITKQEKALR